MSTKPRIRVNTSGEVTGAVIDGEVVRPTAQYMKGNQSPFFFNFNPALRDQRDDVRAGYVEAAARTIDFMHNSGWLAGAVDQVIASMLGPDGLRLAARPDRLTLGWTQDSTDRWTEIVERLWSTWSENPLECDAAGKMNMSQMEDAVTRRYYTHGEALALLPFIRRAFTSSGTKVMLLPPHRMPQDTNFAERMFQGIRTDGYGLPTSYRIRNSNDPKRSALTTDIRARDSYGRPQVIHVFEGYEEQMRGISPLAPALKVLKQYDQLSDATLQAALIQALFAATVESEAPSRDILEALQSDAEQDAITSGEGITPTGPSLANYVGAAAGWYEGTKIDLGGPSRVVHMFPNEKLKFNRSEHPNSTYEPFAKFLLREVARCIGATFEEFTGDYNGVTYTGARLGTSANWPIVTRRRRNIPARFKQIVFEAWLEEQVEAGLVPFPGGINGFLANRAAAVQANWRGPAKPQADDLKTAKAHEIYLRAGVQSRERVADDLGFDYGDEVERIAKERSMREQLGIPEGDLMLPPPTDEPDDPEDA